MGVKKEKAILVPAPMAAVFAASVEALTAMGADVEKVDTAFNVIYAKTGFTWRSFGENIRVTVIAREPGSEVHISSETQQTSVITDYGKNSRNIERFEAALMPRFTLQQEVIPARPSAPAPAPTLPVPKLFISYRREDSADVTGRIYDRLLARFGREYVFKDVDNIPLGVNFKTHLENAVAECSVLLAIIGRQWLDIVDANGARRLDNPSDFVRIEIEAALRLNLPVIPLLVQGAAVPPEDRLPPTMSELAYRNGAPVRPDPDFHHDMDRLIKGLTGA